jgi:hypothetical protein
MKLLFRLVSAAAACLVLTSCVVTSENPIAGPEASCSDPELVGTWHSKDKDDEIVVFSVKNAHRMHVLDGSTGKPTQAHDFSVAVIDGEKYMQFHDYDETLPGFTFVRYRMIQGRGVMTTWLMDTKKAAKLVQSGALKGVVQKNTGTDIDVRLICTATELAEFLHIHGPDTLFSDKGSNLYR